MVYVSSTLCPGKAKTAQRVVVHVPVVCHLYRAQRGALSCNQGKISDLQQLVRQLVAFQRTRREMFGEDGAAALDRGHEAVCKTACKTFQIPGVNSVQ